MPNEEQPGAIEGKSFSQPYRLREEVRAQGGTLLNQPAYSLTEADWVRLKHAEPKVFKYMRSFLILAIGAAIPPAAKLASQWLFPGVQDTPVALWEWVVPLIFLVIALVPGAVGLAVGDESGRVKRTIDEFFEWGRSARRR